MRLFMRKTNSVDEMRFAYQAAMNILNVAVDEATAKTAKGENVKISRPDVIHLFMQALKIDLFGSDLTRILFLSTNELRRWDQNFIPHFPMPKNYRTERRLNMPVGDNIVVSVPWSKDKWGGALRDLTCADFDYRLNYCSGDFFPELQLIRVYNGRHHLALAKLKNQGAVDVDVYPLTLCFPYFKTDGAYWIDKRSGKKQRVYEIRFAILYALARELWKENRRNLKKRAELL